jgi:photosystem II stability/assembly factor-like uncharacterized protein
MNDDVDIESALRASLTKHAGRAPLGDDLAERILVAVDRPVAVHTTSGHRWRAWTLPLIASGAVAAAVAAVIVGVSGARHDADRPAVSAATTHLAPAPTSPTSTPAPTSSAPPSSVVPPPPSGLRNVRLQDLTFVGATDGWGLGTANCTTGTPGVCTAMVVTTDAGLTWHSIRGPGANVPGVGSCADPCVTGLRFADDRIGYAYGPSAFFMTIDGGATWQPQPGGATQLASLNGTVLRTGSLTAGTAAQALYSAVNGSASFKPVALPAASGGRQFTGIFRAANYAYLSAISAGGGHTGELLASADNGRTWSTRGNPCTGLAQTDLAALSGSADGTVLVECSLHQPDPSVPSSQVRVSTDGGATFGPARAAPSSDQAIAAASAQAIFYSDGPSLYRSIDDGASWQPVAHDAKWQPSSGSTSFLGFESAALGRWTTQGTGGVTIWTTHDAGRTWEPYRF